MPDLKNKPTLAAGSEIVFIRRVVAERQFCTDFNEFGRSAKPLGVQKRISSLHFRHLPL
jgi:hypothetical protein